MAVLEFAIDVEIEANRFHMGLAKQAKIEAMRRIFEGFGKEELGRKAKLEAMKKGKTATLTPAVPDLKIADYMAGVEPTPNMDYKDVLIWAMQKEKASFHLYTDLVEVVENKAQRKAFYSWPRRKPNTNYGFEIEYDNVVSRGN